MHPIERLRWVARAPDGEVTLVVAEAAGALASFADDPAGLVIACRRLIARRPSCGPMWWMASRMLCALDPGLEADLVAADLERDPTPAALAEELPGATVAVVGWPEQASLALRARHDDGTGTGRVLVVDAGGLGWRLVDWLESVGVDARLVKVRSGEPAGTAGERVAKAARRAALVLLEAHATGPGSFVADAGSGALARAARAASRPVWLVAGVGRRLPGPLYDALVARTEQSPGAAALEILPLDLVDEVAGPSGVTAAGTATAGADRFGCPVAAELLRFSG